ncbi:MAG TPA: S8 family serine peptidase [Steroidobacteraceae bacterium]|nr:S8 family serine peptidase [Steroidobacteraceae bacterium]
MHALAALPLQAFGTRSAQQIESSATAKMDATLADLSRHWSPANSGQTLNDLRSLSPAARFRIAPASASPLVLIDAVTRGNPLALQADLIALGLQGAAVYANDVGGWLPITSIRAAAALSSLSLVRAAMPHTRTGAVESQGDFAQGSEELRATYPALTGAGVTVGVLSDSFNCYGVYAKTGSGVPASGQEGYAPNGFLADAEEDIATADLPSSVNVLKEASCLDYGAPTQLPFTDEGRAMLQIVFDVAPKASLAFYTADDSEADFANGIGGLAAAGATVEADDVGYFDEPFYQDGILAQAIDAVEAKGVAYFSAAGNGGTLSYENTAPSFATRSSSSPNSGEYLLNFDTSGASTATALPVKIPSLYPGEFIAIVVEWDQPYVTGAADSPGASSSIDLCVTGSTASDEITNLDGDNVSCTGPNATGVDPVQILIIANPANAAGDTGVAHLNLMVGLADGTIAPGRLKLTLEDDGAGSTIDAFATNSPSLQGHPGAVGAIAVGAAFFEQTPLCGTTPAVLESYSSAGGDPILFDTSGARLTSTEIRQKPDIVGPDGVNTTFLGFTLASGGISDNSDVDQCQNDAHYPNVFGTSAATPHAAGIAALVQQANSALTPTEIYTALRTSAAAMGSTTPNYQSGYGFVQAGAAIALLPPGAPTLTLSPTSIAAGSSSTLSWSSINTSACTASGDWSGAEDTGGSQSITPAGAGTYTYTLSCANEVGSAQSSVSLMVAAATTSIGNGTTGGGGAVDGLTLLVLATSAFRRLRGPRLALHCRIGAQRNPQSPARPMADPVSMGLGTRDEPGRQLTKSKLV